jgi:transcription antitermination protein NusB
VPATSRRASRAGSPGLLARRMALLALFEDEFRPGSAASALDRLSAERDLADDVRAHAARIVEGVTAHRADLDARITAEAPLIPVPELGRVERSILRSALYEVLYSAATPSGEPMRDAVSLARIYAGDAARRLVNGVLGSVTRSTGGGASNS